MFVPVPHWDVGMGCPGGTPRRTWDFGVVHSFTTCFLFFDGVRLDLPFRVTTYTSPVPEIPRRDPRPHLQSPAPTPPQESPHLRSPFPGPGGRSPTTLESPLPSLLPTNPTPVCTEITSFSHPAPVPGVDEGAPLGPFEGP